MLERIFTYARSTRPHIFNKSGGIKEKMAAQTSGISSFGWYGTILDLSKEYKSIEYIKLLNMWDFMDILNREQANNQYKELLSK